MIEGIFSSGSVLFIIYGIVASEQGIVCTVSSMEDLWTRRIKWINTHCIRVHSFSMFSSILFGLVVLFCFVLCSFCCWSLFWNSRWNCIEYRFLLSSCAIEYLVPCSYYSPPPSSAHTQRSQFEAICTLVHFKKLWNSVEFASLYRGLFTKNLGIRRKAAQRPKRENKNENEKMHELWSHTSANLVAGINCIENFELGQCFCSCCVSHTKCTTECIYALRSLWTNVEKGTLPSQNEL